MNRVSTGRVWTALRSAPRSFGAKIKCFVACRRERSPLQLLEHRYLDIAGSAQNAQQQKLKSIAMHSLELDADILNGKPDHTKSTKFIADLLQICQA